MAEQRLGRLEKVDLRYIWTNEGSEFTPWLAEEENLRLLSETIGITLDLDSIEKVVGSFYADILCKDEEDHWVVIENQLERTDHRHLGQVITYGAGLKTSVIIWIASKFTDEHIAALDWLNEITDESVSFFGVEVEVWRIGNSLAAPKFNIVSQPNDWSREVTARTNKEITPKKLLQLQFWTGFVKYLDEHNSSIKAREPAAQGYMNTSIGRSGFHLSARAAFKNLEENLFNGHEIQALIDIEDIRHFDILKEEMIMIESEFGGPLQWKQKSSRWNIYLRKEVDLWKEEEWEAHFLWLMENMEKLDQVFRRRIQAL